MDTNKKIALGVIVLIAIAGGIYYSRIAKKEEAPLQESYIPPVVENINTSISDKVGSTNPFDVKVSPYEGYKNPFAQ